MGKSIVVGGVLILGIGLVLAIVSLRDRDLAASGEPVGGMSEEEFNSLDYSDKLEWFEGQYIQVATRYSQDGGYTSIEAAYPLTAIYGGGNEPVFRPVVMFLYTRVLGRFDGVEDLGSATPAKKFSDRDGEQIFYLSSCDLSNGDLFNWRNHLEGMRIRVIQRRGGDWESVRYSGFPASLSISEVKMIAASHYSVVEPYLYRREYEANVNWALSSAAKRMLLDLASRFE